MSLITSSALERRSLLFPSYNVRWDVYRASFGNSVSASSSFDLFLPPADTPDLCELPNLQEDIFFPTHLGRIGLLVPRSSANCTVGQQAKVMTEMQQFLPLLRFLVVHETDEERGSQGATLSLTDSEASEGQDFSGIGVFYLPYSEFEHLQIFLDASVDPFNGHVSPRLLEPESRFWHFSVRIGGIVTVSNGPGISAFYWLRFFLFTLLIITPCFRACYLWYSGGGRLHWRRSEETGRIIGILYVPPMPVWMWAARDSNSAPVSDTLTDEEFQELPAIVYRKAWAKKYREDESSQGDFKGDVDLENQPTNDTLDMTASEDGIEMGVEDPADCNDVERSSESIAEPIVHSTDPAHVTTCTMCSICIDDFEDGESLILLPRCKHAFHRECIHPWLLERQGCCPMCKVPVLGGEGETDPSENSSPSNNASESEIEF